MFTQQEAESFVQNVLQNVLAKGDDTLIDKFYSKKFIGHYFDETYNTEDMLKRILKVKNGIVQCSYNTTHVVALGDFIINTSDLSWTESGTDKKHVSTQVVVWLIKNKKIQEAWIITDKEAESNIPTNEEFSNTPASDDAFTQAEARIFFEDLYENIFVNNHIKLLSDYYLDDFIGHANDEIFNLEDIKKRAAMVSQYAENVKFFIKKMMISDNLVTISNRISFILKSTGSIYEVSQYATFLIQNRKIKEAWMVHDNEMGSYRQYNQDMAWEPDGNFLIPFEINKKKKEEYIDRIKIALEVNKRQYNVPNRELECLYYYLAGYSAKETAIEMGISPRTIESYLSHIKNRFNCKNRTELRSILFPRI